MSTHAGRINAEPQRSDRGARHAESPAEPARSISAITPLGINRMAQRKGACACGGGCPRCSAARTSAYTVNAPGDRYEQEADRVAEQVMRMPDPAPRSEPAPGSAARPELPHNGSSRDLSRRDISPAPRRISMKEGHALQRACAQCAGNEEEEVLQRKDTSGGESSMQAPSIVDDVVRSAGEPLGRDARSFMESRFGEDFGDVRVHTDARAAESAAAVRARAYTVGRSVVFGAGEYRPGNDEGRRLLAHELTHVVQQRGSTAGALQRSVVPANQPEPPLPYGEDPGYTPILDPTPVPATPHRPQPIPRPEHCPPPEGMPCTPTGSSPGTIIDSVIFPQDVATLNNRQKSSIALTVASWRSSGAPGRLRVDGYASAEGECRYNWELSCRRAQAIVSELTSPTAPGATGVSRGIIDMFAHGESDEAGPALAPNRNGIISITTPPPPPPPPPGPTPPGCSLPVSIGSGRPGGRSCGGGTDFTHFDFPTVSTASRAKLTSWALLHGSLSHTSVSDASCLSEMAGVLSTLAGSAGIAAFSRFALGTGGTETHGSASTLGSLALRSGSFRTTVSTVKSLIESELSIQAASSGTLNPCLLTVTPPQTHFGVTDGATLKAVIGGTQGEELFVTGFSGNVSTRTYSMNLRFVICDDFGVDEADLYAPGLVPFWILQHERSAALYAPFINELDLPVTINGTF
jgi:outer membrane protein OmpA-like peptidoglycan-associated protein